MKRRLWRAWVRRKVIKLPGQWANPHAGLQTWVPCRAARETGDKGGRDPLLGPSIRLAADKGVMGTVLDLDLVDKETLQSGEAAQERMWLVKDPRPPSPGG